MLRTTVLCVCVLLCSRAAAAAPIAWEAFGELFASVTLEPGPEPGSLPPAIGTPYSVRLTFDPDTIDRSQFPSGSGCGMVSASVELNVGGVAAASDGFGFTNAQLPGTNCFGGFTEFFFGLPDDLQTPWPWDSPAFLLLSYRDLLVDDAFPTVPTPADMGSLTLQNYYWQARGSFTPALADGQNPTPVPEPATFMLFGIGLAAAARRVRARRGSPSGEAAD